MRKFLVLCVPLLALAAGCGLQRDRISTGWEFRVVRPPIVRTESQMLVGATGTFNTTAQTLTQAPGPILDSDVRTFQHHAPAPPVTYTAPAPPAYVPPAAPVMPPVTYAAPPAACYPPAPPVMMSAPVASPRRLTCEEWCELMRAFERRKMPGGEE